jgi:cysteine-rich repeat protein
LDACSTCSSPNVCTTCISNVIYTLIAGKCECALLPVRTYMASGYCLPYPGCLNATKFNNNISCDACDIGNYFIMKDNSTCDCQLGFQLNMSANPVVCYHNCPNGIAPNVSGMCDDGNTNSSDGCTNCTVDEGYYCTF